ncbi:MAG: NAD-dependent epimerase/dehydratase family protein [Alphaproteobacteria bacterium]|nr:NAD-dependent epimerase/dehydratase family protein [Alphaproteobacteria bacterium]MBT7941788.1 NAD-dependent epimerase/dehydratase family protein [Alphaproteobacteria bacterium]
MHFMTVLVTGAAGFIGFHTSRALLQRGDKVIGVDNLNDYYDVSLKQARLDVLGGDDGFRFECLDIADRAAVEDLIAKHGDITRVVHLASQAGVRHSLIDPYAYTRSNVEGHLVLLETCRRLARLDHFVYASSSSVYGGNTKMPFSIQDPVDTPLSLYAATKRSMELMAHSFAHIYAMPLTGLRFFTVYGPWGRPDMAAMIFIRKILADEPIPVFNNGDMRRDFTYIDDIVAGVLAVLDKPPVGQDGLAPARVYNIGNNHSEPLMRYISLLEEALGKKAEIDFQPMQVGDVPETTADITETQRDFGFQPKTSIDEGLPRLVAWYKDYYGA